MSRFVAPRRSRRDRAGSDSDSRAALTLSRPGRAAEIAPGRPPDAGRRAVDGVRPDRRRPPLLGRARRRGQGRQLLGLRRTAATRGTTCARSARTRAAATPTSRSGSTTRSTRSTSRSRARRSAARPTSARRSATAARPAQAEDQAGAEEDRQWLAHDPNDANTVYFNYHDFALQAPIIEKSTDGGAQLRAVRQPRRPDQPAVPVRDRQHDRRQDRRGEGREHLRADRRADDDAGRPAAAPTAASPTTARSSIAHHKGCNGDQFENTTVYSNDGGSFSNLFISNAVGPDGALFVIASGPAQRDRPLQHLPLGLARPGEDVLEADQVNSGDLKTNVMSAVAAGNKPGQVVVGWYGSQNAKTTRTTRRASGATTWRARTTTARPGSSAAITPNVFHYGDICTVGILCMQRQPQPARLLVGRRRPEDRLRHDDLPGRPVRHVRLRGGGRHRHAAAYIAREACSAPQERHRQHGDGARPEGRLPRPDSRP